MREQSSPTELWTSGEAYERYVGRWSRPVAQQFLDWLAVPGGSRWLDLGCGTGALTQTILATQAPAFIVGIDPSEAFVAFARVHVESPRVEFAVGSADDVGDHAQEIDAAVSGLVLNFVPDPGKAVSQLARVIRPGGIAGCYVWDYADGMQMLRHFWDAASALDEQAAALDEARRSSICDPDSLSRLWRGGGFRTIEARAIDVETTFASFEDFWHPFLAGRAPAPAYAMSLSEERRVALRERLRERLTPDSAGAIRLTARAWAVKGSAA